MDYLDIISKIFGGLGAIGALIVFVILYRLGFLDKKNGNGNGNGKFIQMTDLKSQLDLMQNNEMVHIAIKLDKIIEQNQEQLFILRDIKNGQNSDK